MITELKNEIAGVAESVKAEILYDLQFDINPVAFFRTKFDKDRLDEIRLCNTLYKYNKNG